MTAPTTRETADHAERAPSIASAVESETRSHVSIDHAELAACPFCGGEARAETLGHGKSARTGVKCADVDCPGSMRLVGPDEDGVSFWNRRPREAALLSEIAALRGEVARVEADRIRTVDDRMTWMRRAREAERQRDELRKALDRAADDLRDIGGQSPRPSNSPDPEHENYLRRVLISLAQVGSTRARQALANQGADQ